MLNSTCLVLDWHFSKDNNLRKNCRIPTLVELGESQPSEMCRKYSELIYEISFHKECLWEHFEKRICLLLLYVHPDCDISPLSLPFLLYQGNTLSLTKSSYSIVDFLTSHLVTSRLSILALSYDNKNPNLYYDLYFSSHEQQLSKSLRTSSSDTSLVPPIRQTASIFKQPVTVS